MHLDICPHCNVDYRSHLSSREPSQTFLIAQPSSQAEGGSSCSTELSLPAALNVPASDPDAAPSVDSPTLREITLDAAAMWRYQQQQQAASSDKQEDSKQLEERELEEGATAAAAAASNKAVASPDACVAHGRAPCTKCERTCIRVNEGHGHWAMHQAPLACSFTGWASEGHVHWATQRGPCALHWANKGCHTIVSIWSRGRMHACVSFLYGMQQPCG